LGTYQRLRGSRFSLQLQVQAATDEVFQEAMDEVRLVMRARRHIGPNAKEDFYFGTPDSYMDLWRSISGAFFMVFVMISAISALVGGIVIMNIMLVSVTERTKEIGVRRACGARQHDILRQFLAEAVIQCLIGGALGVLFGFGAATLLKSLTDFPAAVKVWVALLGLTVASVIGLFFGIYPAVRAAKLDPVVALRSE
jgi:putative ABC transport system permease protein